MSAVRALNNTMNDESENSVPRYHFNLIHDGAHTPDPQGMVLPDLQSADCHARRVSSELLVHNELHKRCWALDVCDENGTQLFEMPFSAIDRTLDHLNEKQRELIEVLSRNRREMQKTLADARVNRRRARATLARWRGQPYLVTENGQRL
jgi:hypothetical protein